MFGMLHMQGVLIAVIAGALLAMPCVATHMPLGVVATLLLPVLTLTTWVRPLWKTFGLAVPLPPCRNPDCGHYRYVVEGIEAGVVRLTCERCAQVHHYHDGLDALTVHDAADDRPRIWRPRWPGIPWKWHPAEGVCSATLCGASNDLAPRTPPRIRLRWSALVAHLTCHLVACLVPLTFAGAAALTTRHGWILAAFCACTMCPLIGSAASLVGRLRRAIFNSWWDALRDQELASVTVLDDVVSVRLVGVERPRVVATHARNADEIARFIRSRPQLVSEPYGRRSRAA